MSTLFHNILRAAASAMEIPLVICLLLLAFSVFSLGWWLAELLGERRHMNASLPRLLETMRSGERPLPDCIAAAVCLCVSTVRRRWYNGYMADLEKRGEVYYDARTGTYYIVPNVAGT